MSADALTSAPDLSQRRTVRQKQQGYLSLLSADVVHAVLGPFFTSAEAPALMGLGPPYSSIVATQPARMLSLRVAYSMYQEKIAFWHAVGVAPPHSTDRDAVRSYLTSGAGAAQSYLSSRVGPELECNLAHAVFDAEYAARYIMAEVTTVSSILSVLHTPEIATCPRMTFHQALCGGLYTTALKCWERLDDASKRHLGPLVTWVVCSYPGATPLRCAMFSWLQDKDIPRCVRRLLDGPREEPDCVLRALVRGRHWTSARFIDIVADYRNRPQWDERRALNVVRAMTLSANHAADILAWSIIASAPTIREYITSLRLLSAHQVCAVFAGCGALSRGALPYLRQITDWLRMYRLLAHKYKGNKSTRLSDELDVIKSVPLLAQQVRKAGRSFVEQALRCNADLESIRCLANMGAEIPSPCEMVKLATECYAEVLLHWIITDIGVVGNLRPAIRYELQQSGQRDITVFRQLYFFGLITQVEFLSVLVKATDEVAPDNTLAAFIREHVA